MNQLTPFLRYRLPALLDSAAVSELRGILALSPATHRILLDAARVASIEPVGALRLWEFCQEQHSRGLLIELAHLPPPLAQQLRVHPLLEFASDEDGLFADPFGSLECSGR